MRDIRSTITAFNLADLQVPVTMEPDGWFWSGPLRAHRLGTTPQIESGPHQYSFGFDPDWQNQWIEGSYNPEWFWKFLGYGTPTDELTNKLLREVNMIADGFRLQPVGADGLQDWARAPHNNDNGRFGIAVAQRLKELNIDNTELLFNMRIDKATLQVHSYGLNDGLSGGASAGTLEADVLIVERGYNPQPGQVLDRTKLRRLVEVKASFTASATSARIAQLREYFFGITTENLREGRKVVQVRSSFKWTRALGWTVNKKTLAVAGLATGLGVVGTAQAAMTSYNTVTFPEEAERDFDQTILPAMRRANQTRLIPAEYGGALYELIAELRRWIAEHFGVDGTTLNLSMLGAFYSAYGFEQLMSDIEGNW